MSRPRSSVPNQYRPSGACRIAVRICSVAPYGASNGAKMAATTNSTMMNSAMVASRWVRTNSHQRLRRHVAVRAGAFVAAVVVVVVTMVTLLPVPDSRIDEAVREIDDEVDQNEDGGVHDDAAHDDRIVTHLHRPEDQQPQSGDREDGLQDHRAAEDRADLQAEHREHRQDRATGGVLEQDRGA